MELKYLLFCLSIDLFDVKDFKRNLADGNLIIKCVQREFVVAIFMVWGILLGKNFGVMNNWQAPVRKRLKGSTSNYEHTFLRVLHKTMRAFLLIMSYPFIIAITWRALKGYFTWKQLKVDYSKNISKEENRGHSFVCLLVGYISVKKKKKKLKTAILLMQELRI